MDISTTGIRPATVLPAIALPAITQGAETGAEGLAAPAGDRALRVQQLDAREAAQDLRHPMPQILQAQASDSLLRLAISQTEPTRLAETRPTAIADRDGLHLRAQRAYSETSGIEAETRALMDRVVLLPEKGDLSLEASQLPPYGPPPFGPAPLAHLPQEMALPEDPAAKADSPPA